MQKGDDIVTTIIGGTIALIVILGFIVMIL
jgi:hypothetical protein